MKDGLIKGAIIKKHRPQFLKSVRRYDICLRPAVLPKTKLTFVITIRFQMNLLKDSMI